MTRGKILRNFETQLGWLNNLQEKPTEQREEDSLLHLRL